MQKFLCLCPFLFVLIAANSLPIGQNSLGKRVETLDRNGKFVVSWEAFTDVQTIYFNVTVETQGFVGFGISPVGGMTAADIVIGGVRPDGSSYFGDYHGINNSAPVIDVSQDWTLLSYDETDTHTSLNFARLWNTCDEQDAAIGNDTTNFIWAFGESDTIAYHQGDRGTFAVNPLDPAMVPFDASEFKLWKMTKEMVMPKQKTTYWCTVQKSPANLTETHHIVGFRPLLETDEAAKYVHHFIVHKCKAPAGTTAEAYFEPFLSQNGGHCYTGSSSVPLQHCTHYLFVWAVGGKMVTFPEYAGYPLATNGNPDYYLLEIHYDNPNEDENIQFEAGLELFYTPKLREYNSGTITSGHETRFSITIPPKSTNYTIVGHCSSKCTSETIPPEGIKIFNILLHSHLAGRKLKLRHFRDGEELPWLAADNNYNFDYQQNRPLAEERTILPGDSITYECTYDSMWANGTILGGLSTAEEMCNAFIWFYPDNGLEICSSEIPNRRILDFFGIEQIRGSTIEDPIVTAPAEMANKSYSEVLDTMVEWTQEFRAQFQDLVRYDGHNDVCVQSGRFVYPATGELITYPTIGETYTQIDECSSSVPTATTDDTPATTEPNSGPSFPSSNIWVLWGFVITYYTFY